MKQLLLKYLYFTCVIVLFMRCSAFFVPESEDTHDKRDNTEQPNTYIKKSPHPFAAPETMRGFAWVGQRNPPRTNAMTTLADTGGNWVSLTPFAWMRAKESAVEWDPNTGWWGETRTGIEVTTTDAQALGISVMLKPHIWIRGASAELWRGTLKFDDELSWERFEMSYRHFILDLAKIASDANIDAFCIGTELTQFVKLRPQFWLQLVKDVREIYKGPLTYAAHHDLDKGVEVLWPVLDFIGIQAYLPVSLVIPPTVEALSTGFATLMGLFDSYAKQHGKSIVFTEVGYKNTTDAAATPWIWPEVSTGAVVDDAIQALIWQLFFESASTQPWLKGMFIWKWFPDDHHIDRKNILFTPQNGPALKIISAWYQEN